MIIIVPLCSWLWVVVGYATRYLMDLFLVFFVGHYFSIILFACVHTFPPLWHKKVNKRFSSCRSLRLYHNKTYSTLVFILVARLLSSYCYCYPPINIMIIIYFIQNQRHIPCGPLPIVVTSGVQSPHRGQRNLTPLCATGSTARNCS